MAGKLNARRPPFSYQSGNTPLHRFPAGAKLAALFVLSITAFGSMPGLLFSALCCAVSSRAAGIKVRELLRGSRPLVFLAAFVLVFKTVDLRSSGIALAGMRIPFVSGAGFLAGLLSGLRLMVSFAAGSLLFAVTTLRELRLALGAAEQAVINRCKRPGSAAGPLPSPPRRYSRVSLGISLTLGFIPRFFELWETVNRAWDARSGGRGIRRLITLIPLVCERMMETAAHTAEALEARGFTP
jgi:biotin transport system permease protein